MLASATRATDTATATVSCLRTAPTIRARVRRTIRFLTFLALGGALVPAYAGAAPTVTIRVTPRVSQFHRLVAIRGRAGHRSGQVISLEANRFPFDAGFEPVARQRTGRRGAYEFHAHPGHAVRYRVVSGSAASQVSTVFVEPAVSQRRCNLCGASSRAGSRILRLSFRLGFPEDALATESSKRVYFYYGQRNGSSKPPATLHLAETVWQRRIGGDRTSVAIRHRVRLPHRYRFAIAACLRTTMSTDGIGLPGPPGSHGCGDARITYRQSRRWLG
jgi:hypothetical protein